MGRRLALFLVLALAILAGCMASAPPGPTPGGQHPVPAEGPRSHAEGAGSGPAVGDDHELTLLQMNLCLSGIARCVPGTQPAETVAEAIAQVRRVVPDLVVLNEACSKDVARIAAAGRLHVTFSEVAYLGTTLPCRHPAGRGVFGNAVLTAERPLAVHEQAFGLQDRIEERRVVCVHTAPLRVCGTHLNIRASGQAGTNAAQCLELGRILTTLSPDRPTVVSGDMNRTESCAPTGWWTLTDHEGGQGPGVQQAYGDPRLASPSAAVEPMSHTDHDALVVRFSIPAAY